MVFFVRISASARAKREREFVCVSRCEAIGLRVGRLLKIFQNGREREKRKRAKTRTRAEEKYVFNLLLLLLVMKTY